ncbi:ubiquitin carboxyl-terminal hydrolase CYLD-like [Paroedura picta]|uniref:ubiquitin carboxyl-terminal hydrolase CYLD-like n=1 Tax=Paroedura picta TaxID=143630 RepID=UPI0040571886
MEAFIVSQGIHAGRKKIPLGSIGCFVKGKHSMGRIVDRKSRPLIALPNSHVKPLSHHQAALLLSIDSPEQRYSLFCNEQHFTSICLLKIHDVVQLRCGRVRTVGVVRGFWERLRNPGNGELKMILIEVELLDPRIIALSNRFSRLKVDASKIIMVSSRIAISPCCKEIEQRSHKNEDRYLIENWADNNREHEILLKMEGAMKGIQGHCNSCYLDTTLFSLFGFSSALDSILDCAEVHDTTAQQILREQIVAPLRQYGYVGAENIMHLRKLLRSDSFITEEKDPEEFLNVLLGEVLATEPLLRIKADNEVLEYNCYQVLVERGSMVHMPTVQQLLEESLLSYDMTFAEIPSCLILQMPRFGKEFKTFPSVYPSLELDLTSLVEQAPQLCNVCGGQVTYGCSRCHLDSLLIPSHRKLLRGIAKKAFSHEPRQKHSCTEQKLNSWSTKSQTLELFAVLCIESNHYVAFVRCGASRWSWLFFDSMAGQLQNDKGSHIPVVKACPQLGHYLAMAPEEISAVTIKQMDQFSRKFFCDSYTFMYHRPKFSSYAQEFRN